MASNKRNIGFLVVLVSLFGIWSVVAQETTEWTVDGRYIMANGEAQLLKGINYSPIPIGASQTDDNANRGDVFTSDFAFIHDRDLPMIRAMGANSIRLYDVFPWWYPSEAIPEWSAENDLDHTAFLDMCWNGGVEPIYVWVTHHMGTSFHVATSTNGVSPDGRPTWRLADGQTAYMDPAWDTADLNRQAYARNAYVALATKYGSHPAVIGFVISNEQNNDRVRGSWQFWKWFDETARQVKAVAPTKLTSMTLVDDGLISVMNAESFGMDSIDTWGINSYRGTATSGFDNLFDSFASMSNRPLWIGEYGPPASTRDSSSGEIIEMPNNAQLQADYIAVHWQDVLDHRDICSGAFVFEWVDEWWKGQHPDKHDASEAPNLAYPGGWGDEEWFGIHSAAMIDASASPADYRTRGADVLHERAAALILKELFSAQDPPLPPQAPPTPITLIPFAPLAPFAPIAVPQNAPTTGPSPSTAPSQVPSPSASPSVSPTPRATPVLIPTANPVGTLTPSAAASLSPDIGFCLSFALLLFAMFVFLDFANHAPQEHDLI